MSSNKPSSALAKSTLIVTLSLGVALSLGTGCKKGSATKDTESASTSAASTSAAAPSSSVATVTGPCGDLQVKFCSEAGEESGLCGSAKGAFGVLPDSACKAAITEFSETQKKIKAERKVCDDLIQKICAGVGPETDTCKMVTEKTQQFPTDRCTQMMQQTDAIIKDLQRQEMANKPLTKELQASIAATDAPSFGPADAKVTVVEFSDFECPYCSRAADVVQKLRDKYGDKVRFVFRQFPLSFHKNAQPAAEAALAAHAQGKFWEYHDKLFENQRQLDEASLEGYAKEMGLDMTKFKEALEKNEFEDEVKADMKLGEEVAVQGTPTMFINGERVPNATDVAALEKTIDKHLGS